MKVFLGGSCGQTTWREREAVPWCKANGVTFFNPQVLTWTPDLMLKEHKAKEEATFLLFVIDGQTRATVSMVEVAHLVGEDRNVLLVMDPFPHKTWKTLSILEEQELACSRAALLTLVPKSSIFGSIGRALHHINVSEGDLKASENRSQSQGEEYVYLGGCDCVNWRVGVERTITQHKTQRSPRRKNCNLELPLNIPKTKPHLSIFAIFPHCRAILPLLEVAFLLGRGDRMLLVLNDIHPSVTHEGQKDYERVRQYIRDMAMRKNECKLFENVDEACKFAVNSM